MRVFFSIPAVAVWLLLFGAGGAGCIPAAFTDVPAVRGRVVGWDGRGVAGAEVEFSRKPGTPGPMFDVTVTAGEDGGFAYPGRTRFVLWMIPADVFAETALVRARHAGGESIERELPFRPQVRLFGLGRPLMHDLGDVEVPTFAATASRWPDIAPKGSQR